MRCAFVLLVLFAAVPSGITPVHAQDAPSRAAPVPVDGHPLMALGASEWIFAGGPAFGVSIFHSDPGHRYVLSSLSWGRVLTRLRGPGALRGQFMWAVEAIPLFGQSAPEGTVGIGFTPIVWRWNFAPRRNVAPFAEIAGGLLWTGEPVPARTTTTNFTAHIAYGVRYFLRPGRAFVASYRFHHISNGNRLERNPGVNAHVAQVGFSLVR